MTATVVTRSSHGVCMAWCGCVLWSCSSEVSVHILPGDNALSATPDAGCAGDSSCPRRAWALAFEGPYDRVEVPSTPLLDVPQDFTIEAWVMVESFAGGHGVFNRWLSTAGDIQLTFGTPEILSKAELPAQEPVPSHTLAAWGYLGTNSWITVYSSMLPTTGAWHHVASSYGGGALKLYVDGSRWGITNGTGRIANPDSRVFIGATSRSEMPIDPSVGERWWPPIHGLIAEVRISGTDRYTVDFAPDRRLAADAATIALWHLDEGNGNLAADSGPNHLNGTVVNATWVEVASR